MKFLNFSRYLCLHSKLSPRFSDKMEAGSDFIWVSQQSQSNTPSCYHMNLCDHIPLHTVNIKYTWAKCYSLSPPCGTNKNCRYRWHWSLLVKLPPMWYQLIKTGEGIFFHLRIIWLSKKSKKYLLFSATMRQPVIADSICWVGILNPCLIKLRLHSGLVIIAGKTFPCHNKPA